MLFSLWLVFPTAYSRSKISQYDIFSFVLLLLMSGKTYFFAIFYVLFALFFVPIPVWYWPDPDPDPYPTSVDKPDPDPDQGKKTDPGKNTRSGDILLIYTAGKCLLYIPGIAHLHVIFFLMCLLLIIYELPSLSTKPVAFFLCFKSVGWYCSFTNYVCTKFSVHNYLSRGWQPKCEHSICTLGLAFLI